jgi:hypothetical protein
MQSLPLTPRSLCSRQPSPSSRCGQIVLPNAGVLQAAVQVVPRLLAHLLAYGALHARSMTGSCNQRWKARYDSGKSALLENTIDANAVIKQHGTTVPHLECAQ